MYTFEIHRVTLLALIGLVVALSGLTFFAGVVVGASWTMRELGKTIQPMPIDRPAVDADLPEPGKTIVPLAAAAEPEVPAPPASAATPPASAVAPPASAPPPEPAAFDPGGAGESAAPASAAAPAGRDEPVADDDPIPPVDLSAFAVQLGAFLSEENADALLAEIQSRGYEPYIHRMRTNDGRPLHSVRIGRYAERKDAWDAAQRFTDKENLPASIIRTPRAP